MIDKLRPTRLLLAVLGATALLLQLAPARAADEFDSAILLVAKRQVRDPFYATSVLLVRPLEGGGHAGFVLNKPTNVALGDAFPDDEPSQKVREPVFLGGPVNPNVIFALVRANDSPGAGSIRFAKNLYLALEGDAVDRIIQKDAERARFFAGAVLWQPGELDDELKRGAWYVMDADSELALRRDTKTLWEELVRRSERHASML
jgi:putative transcriptional regulator